MINRSPLSILILPALLAGCASFHGASHNATPDLDGIILDEISWQSSTVQEVFADIGRQCARKYPDVSLGFEARLSGDRERNTWSEYAPNYFVFLPSGDKNCYAPQISLRAKDISLRDALSLICMTSGLTYWTEGSVVVVGVGSPVFQAPILRYDPVASNLLTQALCHLLSDPDAYRDLSSYLVDPSSDEKPPLRRLLLNTASFPKHFTFAVPNVSAIMTTDLHHPETGDLTVSVHRYLERGTRKKMIVFFVTGRNVMGGGWFTYYAIRTDVKWTLQYAGFYDP